MIAEHIQIDQSQPLQPVDARSGDRYKLLLPLSAICGGTRVPVHLLDLSKSGALVHSVSPRPAGEIIWLRWKGQDIRARIVWSRGARFGVQFGKSLNDRQFEDMMMEAGAPLSGMSWARRTWLKLVKR
jgi:hypothetical protein